MKLRSLRVDRQPKLMIIPMIDIIFFLLVFFMMSMLNMVVQKSIPLQLPQAAVSKVNLDTTLPVTVLANGTIYVEQEVIPENLLKQRLEVEKNRNPKVAVILRGDAGVQYGKMVGVLDVVKSAGIQKVAIATESK